MKYSQFNTIVPYGQGYALYNAFEQKAIIIVDELRDLLLAAINEGVDKLKHYHPSFYRYLIVENFLIEDTVDEVQKVKDLVDSLDNDPRTFELTVNPTMNCNFKCWYCYESHIKGSRLEDKTFESLKKFISKTATQKELEYFSLSFFGGEPLLHFKRSVVPVIDHFVAECKQRNLEFGIGFTTNGFLISQEFIDYFSSIGIRCALQITLDGYADDHDKVRYVSSKVGSYQKIIENIKLLIRHEFFVVVRVNYTSENIGGVSRISDEFVDIPKDLLASNLIFDFHQVWQDQRNVETTRLMEENVQGIKNSGLEVRNSFSTNAVRDSCYADKRNSVTVNYNGDIFKCTARDFTKENREGFIDENGELIWENGSLEKRMSSKFNNKPCLSCKILPLCNGGCSQHAIERHGEDYCIYDGDESEKDKIVYIKVEEILGNRNSIQVPSIKETQRQAV